MSQNEKRKAWKFHTAAVMMTLSERRHAECVELALSGSSKNSEAYSVKSRAKDFTKKGKRLHKIIFLCLSLQHGRRHCGGAVAMTPSLSNYDQDSWSVIFHSTFLLRESCKERRCWRWESHQHGERRGAQINGGFGFPHIFKFNYLPHAAVPSVVGFHGLHVAL